MNISNYIKELLYLYDCVIIPGLGGFVTNYRPAEISFETNTFIPPSKDILFNSELKNNDGLLINHIANNLNIEFGEASRIVSTNISQIMSKLENGESFTFKGIGSLRYDRFLNLQFSPELSENFLVEAYGFGSFNRLPIKNLVQNSADNFQLFGHKSFFNPENIFSIFNKQLLKKVLIASPLIIALSIIPFNTELLENNRLQYASFYRNEKTAPSAKTENNTEIIIETTGKTSQNETSEIKEIAVNTSYRANEKKTSTNSETKKYHLIAGSFKSEENANAFINELKYNDLNTTVIRNNEMYRVSIFSSDNKKTSQQKLLDLKAKKIQTWLLKTQ